MGKATDPTTCTICGSPHARGAAHKWNGKPTGEPAPVDQQPKLSLPRKPAASVGRRAPQKATVAASPARPGRFERVWVPEGKAVHLRDIEKNRTYARQSAQRKRDREKAAVKEHSA